MVSPGFLGDRTTGLMGPDDIQSATVLRDLPTSKHLGHLQSSVDTSEALCSCGLQFALFMLRGCVLASTESPKWNIM